MCTSNWQNISYNIDLIRKINPKSILDLGVGFGRWGILSREFLEIWDNEKYPTRWERVIDGVEIFSDYIKPYHYLFYNEIYFTDALFFMRENQKKYDLIICGDIIEHMEKEDGFELISLCLKNSKYLLINIPLGKNWVQTKKYDNIYEEHKSVWEKKDFKKYRYKKIKIFDDIWLRKFAVILLSENILTYRKDFKTKYGKYFRIKNILNNKLHLKIITGYIEKIKK